jgi:hypothetical protein
MKFIFMLVVLSMLTGLSFAQDVPYQFVVDKVSKEIQMTRKNSIIRFPTNYVTTADGDAQVRYLMVNGTEHKMFIKKTEEGKVKQIVGNNGEVIGTLKMKGRGVGNILLPTGEELQSNRISQKEWSYHLNGQEVIRGYLMEIDKKDYVQITKYDSLLPDNDALKVLALDLGIRSLEPRGQLAGYIVAAAALAAIRVLMESASSQ